MRDAYISSHIKPVFDGVPRRENWERVDSSAPADIEGGEVDGDIHMVDPEVDELRTLWQRMMGYVPPLLTSSQRFGVDGSGGAAWPVSSPGIGVVNGRAHPDPHPCTRPAPASGSLQRDALSDGWQRGCKGGGEVGPSGKQKKTAPKNKKQASERRAKMDELRHLTGNDPLLLLSRLRFRSRALGPNTEWRV